MIKPLCPKGHVMEIKDQSDYNRCDGCKSFKSGEQWCCPKDEEGSKKEFINHDDDDNGIKHLTYCFDCVSDQGAYPFFIQLIRVE